VCSCCAGELPTKPPYGVLYGMNVSTCNAVCFVRLEYVWRDQGISNRLMAIVRKIWR